MWRHYREDGRHDRIPGRTSLELRGQRQEIDGGLTTRDFSPGRASAAGRRRRLGGEPDVVSTEVIVGPARFTTTRTGPVSHDRAPCR